MWISTGILAPIVFFAIYFICEYIRKKRFVDGNTLKKEVKPYYDRIKEILNPYITIEFSKQVIYDSQKELKRIYLDYESYKEQNKLSDSELSVFLIHNNNNRFIVNCFALAFLYTFRMPPRLSPQEEERNAENAIFDYCQKKLAQFGNEIPEIISNYFEINIKALQINLNK